MTQLIRAGSLHFTQSWVGGKPPPKKNHHYDLMEEQSAPITSWSIGHLFLIVNCKTVILLLLKGLCGSTSFICGQKLLHFHVEQPFDYLMCFLCVCMLCRHAANAPSAETIETAFQGQKKKKDNKKKRKCFHCDHHNRSLWLQWLIVLFSERHNLPDASGDVDGYYLGCNSSVSHSQTWAPSCFVVVFSPCDVLYPT